MRLCALLACAAFLAGCGGGKPKATAPADRPQPVSRPASGGVPWPAPKAAVRNARAAGVPVDRFEYGVPGHPGTHIHSHLDVFVNGEATLVPPGLGIQIDVPGVRHGQSPDGTPTYGGITLCARPCIAALHTHDDSGVLHVESKEQRTYTLGEVFTEWHVRLDASCVGGYCPPQGSLSVYVNGDRRAGNPAGIELKDREEIAIVIGTPPKEIPSSFF
jgi:hypothetical protein